MPQKRSSKKRVSGGSSKIEVRAVDLFCGAGGLTRGLEAAGIDVVTGVDIDPACEYPFTANNRAYFPAEIGGRHCGFGFHRCF